MAATFITTVTVVEHRPFGGSSCRIDCTCGEQVTYSGEAFTQVEAQRHQAWHQKQAGK